MPVTPFGILNADDLKTPAAHITSCSVTAVTATTTALNLGFEAFDNAGIGPGAGTNLTASEAGLWLAVANLEFASHATGWRRGEFLVNGGTPWQGETVPAVNGEPTRLSYSVPLVLSAGGTVAARARHTAGVNLLVTGTFGLILLARA